MSPPLYDTTTWKVMVWWKIQNNLFKYIISNHHLILQLLFLTVSIFHNYNAYQEPLRLMHIMFTKSSKWGVFIGHRKSPWNMVEYLNLHNVELKIKQMNKNCKNSKEIKRMWNWNILSFYFDQNFLLIGVMK
jgi:hypothetical protein